MYINPYYLAMDTDDLAAAIRRLPEWDAEMLDALAHQTGVDISAAEDGDAAADLIEAASGIHLY